MGGDRDGNPNVTHNVTQEVLWLSRWKAAELYLRDIENLRWEFSIQQCSPEIGRCFRDISMPSRTVNIYATPENA